MASERGSVELHGVGLGQGLHWRRETRVRRSCTEEQTRQSTLPSKVSSGKLAHPLNPERGEQMNRSQCLCTCLILSGCVLGIKKGRSLCLELSNAILTYRKVWEK